jgi:hypothetical protein
MGPVRGRRGGSRAERGAAAVEMAIMLPLLLLVIGGLIDFGRLFFMEAVFANAARDGARMAALGYTNTQIQTRIEQATPGTGGFTFTRTTCPVSPVPTDFAKVVVSPTPAFKWLMLDGIPGVSVPVPTISAEGTMRCSG